MLTGKFTQWYGDEPDLLLLLYDQGPVGTSLNPAPLHHYHSGTIDASPECCNAATDKYDPNTFEQAWKSFQSQSAESSPYASKLINYSY